MIGPARSVAAPLQVDPFAATRPGRWPTMHLGAILAVFLGGCIGGLARRVLLRAWPGGGRGFPWPTLCINLSGALLLAVLVVIVSDVLRPTTYVRPLLGTGFCGAWTTFSAITVSTDELLAHGHAVTGVLYLLASIVGGVGAAALGLVLTRALLRRPAETGVL